MNPAASDSALTIEVVRRERRLGRIGHTIHYFSSIDSTNTVARQLALAGAAEGTVIVAETQTRGRGRLGRAWLSPPFRNLYLSVILRPPVAVPLVAQIGLVVGVATAETVGEWATAAIKWPNDVLIEGRKVAGILTELEADHDRVACVIAGIGINLNICAEDFPPELREKAVSLCAATTTPVDRVAFAGRLLSRLEDRYDLYLRDGFAAIRPLWERLSCLTGRHVQIDDGAQRVQGVVSGIADDGTLRLRGAQGEETCVVAGDVTVVNGYDAAKKGTAGDG